MALGASKMTLRELLEQEMSDFFEQGGVADVECALSMRDMDWRLSAIFRQIAAHSALCTMLNRKREALNLA